MRSHAPPSAAAIVVLGVAIVVRGVMSAVKFRVGRRIRSASLVADGWNDTVDILAAATALTAVGLAMYDSDRFLAADHYGGFAVGIIVIATGVRVLRDASLELMDTMPGSDMIEQVRAEAASVPGVVGIDKSRAEDRLQISCRPAYRSRARPHGGSRPRHCRTREKPAPDSGALDR